MHLTGIHVESLNLVASPTRRDGGYTVQHSEGLSRVSIRIFTKNHKTGEYVKGDQFRGIGF